MEEFNIDIDVEKIFLDNEWFSVDDLATRIRSKLDAGDYKVSRLSAALEHLKVIMEHSKELSIKVTKEVVEAYQTIANNTNESLANTIRNVLISYLSTEYASQLLYMNQPMETAGQSEAIPEAPVADGGGGEKEGTEQGWSWPGGSEK